MGIVLPEFDSTDSPSLFFISNRILGVSSLKCCIFLNTQCMRVDNSAAVDELQPAGIGL